MPGPGFFRKLGLFVVDRFLDRSLCEKVQAEMLVAPRAKGRLTRGKDHDLLDESVRKVDCVTVSKSTADLVKGQFDKLKHSLESHFGIPLTGSETPQFLLYPPGAFFSLHNDSSSSNSALALYRHRKISAVVFVNRAASVPEVGCYGGGSLTLHGILDGPQWENCAFSLEADSGLLVAFPSETVHEVKPVVFGDRYTIVTWFYNSST